MGASAPICLGENSRQPASPAAVTQILLSAHPEAIVTAHRNRKKHTMGNFRSFRHTVERSAKNTESSAASTARSSAETARAARSAATGAWVGAGFQAVTAIEAARAAQYAQEQAAAQQAMAEDNQRHNFAEWRQTPDGMAFLVWREKAIHLAQFLRDRDAQWRSGWARVIGRAQEAIPEAEKQRFRDHAVRLRQVRLAVAALVSLAAAALVAVGLLFQTFVTNPSAALAATDTYTYEQCLNDLADPENFLLSEADCEAIRPEADGSILPLVLLIGLTIALIIMREVRKRAAKTDTTVPKEAHSRVQRWGFDPLTIRPGYTAFPWHTSSDAHLYADELMDLAVNGHTLYPSRSQLITLGVPASHPPKESYPAEINKLLAGFQQEHPKL